ncbi:MAG TPA: EAL domain-containing protein, partial [Acidiferrobacteraceae bacterium]|nr:EAL domain-containing protein [Acidiferrobacteraceae bacterium]
DMAYLVDASIIRATLSRCAAQVLAGAPSRLHFVNISAALLRHPDVVADIFALVQQQCLACGRDPSGPKPIVIEITEREFVQDTATALTALKPLLDFGLRIAIDDFGSGYSSFRYLVDLPVSFLKLEGELVRKIAVDRKARVIVQRMQQLARDLGLLTVAEYVEDDVCRSMLLDMGVDWGQGYLFGRPTVDRAIPPNCLP